ncbi:hypothetical protein LN042_21570 [Kitasatospora sp. RB6PN24]|uniref:hypothetical protein n=1 Tax=Kitasatospora humi TaxID=2893891 RepID=UPI001E2ECC61|nr:hypothetical protein [Kitasatospora humi]MCC9309631.1 hypothetical protein [Kitasatospora humi]
MTSSTLASALAVLGLATGTGLLGYLVAGDVDRTTRPGRDDVHRPDGPPAAPARSDRPHPAPAAPPNPDRLRGTLPAASELDFGTLVRWTSGSAARPKPICVRRVR